MHTNPIRGRPHAFVVVGTLCWAEWRDSSQVNPLARICVNIGYHAPVNKPTALRWHQGGKTTFILQLHPFINPTLSVRSHSPCSSMFMTIIITFAFLFIAWPIGIVHIINYTSSHVSSVYARFCWLMAAQILCLRNFSRPHPCPSTTWQGGGSKYVICMLLRCCLWSMMIIEFYCAVWVIRSRDKCTWMWYVKHQFSNWEILLLQYPLHIQINQTANIVEITEYIEKQNKDTVQLALMSESQKLWLMEIWVLLVRRMYRTSICNLHSIH